MGAMSDFEGEKIVGKFPITATKLVKKWILEHNNELKDAWEKIESGEQPGKIKPLA